MVEHALRRFGALALVAMCLVVTIGPGATGAPIGTRLWAARWGRAGTTDSVRSVAASVDGRKVFVTGDAATVAYGATDGRRLWTVPYGGSTVLTGPDPATLFVLHEPTSVRALNAATGTTRWSRAWPFLGDDYHDWGSATAMTLSRDGARLYVAGDYTMLDAAPGPGFTLVAYDAATGGPLWAETEVFRTEPFGDFDTPTDVAVGPNGARVFVTGDSYSWDGTDDILTVAYDATTGESLWATSYDGPNHDLDAPTSIAVSPNASTVVVSATSRSARADGSFDLVTVALAGGSGATRWVGRVRGPVSYGEGAVAVSPDGSRVVASGTAGGVRPSWLLCSFATATGARQWAARYDGPAHTGARLAAHAFSGDGARVFVTGTATGPTGAETMTTARYAAPTGERTATSTYAAGAGTGGAALAVAGTGRRVYVGGWVVVRRAVGSDPDYVTVGYAV